MRTPRVIEGEEVTFDSCWTGKGEPTWNVRVGGKCWAAGFKTERDARAWLRDYVSTRFIQPRYY